MSGHRYYTLAQLTAGKWYPQFGDYSRKTVTNELGEYIRAGIKKRHLRIIVSGYAQKEIQAVIDAINVELNSITTE